MSHSLAQSSQTPKMPSVLLTGANAFLAAHIINSLIQANYHITGTVRRAAAADAIFSSHPEWNDHLKIVVVEDIANEASWDATFKAASFDHVSSSILTRAHIVTVSNTT